MAEIPEKSIESGSGPENTEDQSSRRNHEAGEFLDEQRDKTVRHWSTEAEREEKADRVGEIISPSPGSIETEEQVHNEAGSPLKVQYKTEAEKRAAIEKLMNSNSSGNDQTEALRELLG